MNRDAEKQRERRHNESLKCVLYELFVGLKTSFMSKLESVALSRFIYYSHTSNIVNKSLNKDYNYHKDMSLLA